VTLKLALAFLKVRRVSSTSLLKRVYRPLFKTLTLLVGMERSRLKIAAISCLLGSAIVLSVSINICRLDREVAEKTALCFSSITEYDTSIGEHRGRALVG